MKAKDWWREEIRKVLDGESIYLTGTLKVEGMAKQEIIEWIVETLVEQEKGKSYDEGYNNGYDDCYRGIQREIFDEP